MNRLIDAFVELFAAATLAAGELAKTANFTLENVNWKDTLSKPESMSHPIVESHLEAACASSGRHGSSSHTVTEALLSVTDQLEWRASSKDSEDGPDVAIFSRNFTASTVIGEGGLLPSNKVIAGFSLQGRDTYLSAARTSCRGKLLDHRRQWRLQGRYETLVRCGTG